MYVSATTAVGGDPERELCLGHGSVEASPIFAALDVLHHQHA